MSLTRSAALSLLLCLSTAIFAADSDRVLLVVNANSPSSVDIGNDYIRKRRITHVLRIRCQDSAVLSGPIPNPDSRAGGILGTKGETVSLALYREVIEAPIKAYLSAHPGLDFIVLTKGIPIRINDAGEPNGLDRFSLDSRLASLDYESLADSISVEIAEPGNDEYWQKWFGRHYKGTAWANRFWNSSQRFSHAQFGGYLVTRLDGYSEADAKALVTRALLAERSIAAGGMPTGAILLDVAPKWGFTNKALQPISILSEMRPGDRRARITSEKAHLGDFNSDMQLAADLLNARGVPVELDETGHFVGNRTNLMGYFSWGSNDPAFNLTVYHSLEFAPGALSDTAVSTGGRTFLPTQGGQSLIADLIAQGVTGIKGYTDEPLVQAVAVPSIVLERYTRGWTLAESFYSGSQLVGWQDIVIGDPLARAYPMSSETGLPRRIH